MPPVTLDDQPFYPFVCLLEDKVHWAMRYDDELYGLLDDFSSDQRSHAASLAHQLQQQGCKATVTTERDRCRVWVSMAARYSN